MKNIILIISILFVSAFAKAQELQSYIQEAESNNPEIQKFELQYKRASEKVNEVNTIPNTEFGVGYFVSEPETRTGAQRFKVSAKQMLPWFGTITSRENYVSSLADAKYEDIVIAKRKLMASVSQSYYNLYANKAKQEVLTENIKLLETYETLALTSVEVGKASAVDVLRLQMRQNEMQQLKDVLQQQFLAEQTKFNNLLNRDNDVTVNVVDSVMIPSEDFDITSENLALHPELLKYDKLYQSIEQSELLNQKESSPMIGFGLDYINVAERPNMDFSDNGEDILIKSYETGTIDFNDVLDIQELQLKFQMNQIESVKTYFVQTTIINYLTN